MQNSLPFKIVRKLWRLTCRAAVKARWLLRRCIGTDTLTEEVIRLNERQARLEKQFLGVVQAGWEYVAVLGRLAALENQLAEAGLLRTDTNAPAVTPNNQQKHAA